MHAFLAGVRDRRCSVTWAGGRAVKRLVDLSISIPAVILLALPFAAIALAIKLDDRGPVLFRQERVGRGGRSFRVWKFRTMIVNAVSQGFGNTVASDDDRITRVGRLLRKFGVDELPQILNVLSGEMSLVGPRPTLSYQVEHYDAMQRRRLEVRPGITSLAVVSGRNALSWVDRIELDVWYIDHWSLGLDLRILFRTLWCVLVTHEGLYGKDGVNDPFIEPRDPP
jgi:undecaprenyl phosphate N,N'-diacetylbacillosamine 1-phosphate transferase